MQETFTEKSDTQSFWLALIRDVFGVINPEVYIEFEKRVLIEHVGFIDAYIPSTGIVIEQKSPGKDLAAAFEQAKRYYDWLPVSQRGRYILTCDFITLHVHDMEYPTADPTIIPVAELSRDKIDFLLTPGETMPLEERISIQAGKLFEGLYKHLRASLDELFPNADPKDEAYKKAVDDLNVFCVRLVFLLYAEDSGLFRKHQFHDFLNDCKQIAATALMQLFHVLNTEPHKHRLHRESVFKAFPYVDGGLFEKEIDFPPLSYDALYIILHDMSESFNWAGISPTIFGAIFESTINEETRKTEGMHYTSINNIHKVIDPLFLDELNAELDGILAQPDSPGKVHGLLAFQDKLASLKFLDPACGSGNFLTESFIHIRRIENKILAALKFLDALPEDCESPVKVSIKQFHGIEVHDFAVNVARTALWISDHQMWKETVQITGQHDSPLPLKEYDHIKKGSAMEELPNLGWKLPGWKIEHSGMLYIMGNPPFLGYSHMTDGQKAEVRACFGKAKSDYVSCWFWKAAEYLHKDERVKAAFVATNSITQGEQPAYVFKAIRERFPIKIEFAHQTFAWKNELPDPKQMAHVHVVVIGFSTCPPETRKLYTSEGVREVENINFYLAEGPDEDIAEPTTKAITADAPDMTLGNLPRDGGNLLIKAEDYADFIKREPGAEKYIKRFVGADEFINNTTRYCLWIVAKNEDELRKMPLVYKRVKAVKAFRLASTRAATREAAKTSWLFDEIRQTTQNYIIVPRVSSEQRKYIPMDWVSPDVIAGDAVNIIPGATLYHFGILTSRVHMAWVKRVCGRLEMRYRYSGTIVYNTFPWPSPSPKQRERIHSTAQAILDARAQHPSVSFAGLYDDSLMPPDLRKAHALNDAAVCAAYGWPSDISENDIVTRLFRLYHELAPKRAKF